MRLHVSRDHLLDDLDLPGDVLFVLDAGWPPVRSASACAAWCVARAVLHRLEELVGERLHHERHDRFGRHRGRAIAGDGAQAERQRERGAAGTGHRPMLCGRGGVKAIEPSTSSLQPSKIVPMSCRTRLTGLLACSLVMIGPHSGFGAGPKMRTLSRQVFEDKIRGGWAGQMIGVSFGAPTEFRSNGKIIEGDLPAWTPNRIENAIDQDDLYVEMTFAAVMDRVGPRTRHPSSTAKRSARRSTGCGTRTRVRAGCSIAASRRRGRDTRNTTSTPTTSTSRSRPTSSG